MTEQLTTLYASGKSTLSRIELVVLSLSGYSSGTVFQRIARALVLLAAIQLLGGHWVALQSAAWIGMAVSYSQQEESWTVALEKTFDGEHPCNLCKAVQSGQSEEKKQQSTKVSVKFEAVLASTFQSHTRFAEEISFNIAEQHSTARNIAPPTPPPLA